jgi:hypothetical protein
MAPEWLAVIVPVAVAAGTVVCRAFTARDRLRRRYAEDVTKVRDRVRAALVLPALATIVVKVHPLIYWPREGLGALRRKGDWGDPENEVRRRLVGHVFVEPLADLARHLAVVRDAEAVQERLLGVEHRQGWPAGLFLLAWLYLSFWASETGVALPRAVTAVSSLVLAGSLGWFLSERLASAREAEAFAALTAETDRLRYDDGAGE